MSKWDYLWTSGMVWASFVRSQYGSCRFPSL